MFDEDVKMTEGILEALSLTWDLGTHLAELKGKEFDSAFILVISVLYGAVGTTVEQELKKAGVELTTNDQALICELMVHNEDTNPQLILESLKNIVLGMKIGKDDKDEVH